MTRHKAINETNICDWNSTNGPGPDGRKHGERHRPVGEQAIERMQIPIDCARAGRRLRFGLGGAVDGREALATVALSASISPTKWFDWRAKHLRQFSECRISGGQRRSNFHSTTLSLLTRSRWSHSTTTRTSSGAARNHRVLEARRTVCHGRRSLSGERRLRISGSTTKVPVQLLSAAEYRSLFEHAGFVNVRDERLLDPTPVPEDLHWQDRLRRAKTSC